MALRGFLAGVAGWLRAASPARAGNTASSNARDSRPLPDRMAAGLAAFDGPVGLILSGRDITAREFLEASKGPQWRRLLADPRVTRHDLPEADHTFSRRAWRDTVARWTLSWLQSSGR